jgi:hypothetical protein
MCGVEPNIFYNLKKFEMDPNEIIIATDLFMNGQCFFQKWNQTNLSTFWPVMGVGFNLMN